MTDPHSYRIAVIGGAGHVGLPLSLMLAEAGLDVVVIDRDAEKLRQIEQGSFPYMEEMSDSYLSRSKEWSIAYTTKYEPIQACDVIFFTVGTPVDEHLNPDLEPVYESLELVKPFLRTGQCVVLRSTLFPGTSENVVGLLEKSGLDVSVCFCPERIAQGQGFVELKQIPQIVAASDTRGLEVARDIFSRLALNVIELSFVEAEIAKLFCNTWRYVQFAIANEFYEISTSKGLDFERIRSAMMLDYERMASFPRPGFAAGPCLFKDTMQLASYSRDFFRLGHQAMLTNETMPDFILNMAKREMVLRDKTVGVLGMAFKPNNDDSRESLAYRLKRLLFYEGAEVLCTDPYVSDPTLVPLEVVLRDSEAIFIGCPHDVYGEIVFRKEQRVFDCWGPSWR